MCHETLCIVKQYIFLLTNYLICSLLFNQIYIYYEQKYILLKYFQINITKQVFLFIVTLEVLVQLSILVRYICYKKAKQT